MFCVSLPPTFTPAAMEKESEGLLKSLDAQAEKISDQVLRRVLPEGVKV